MSEIRVNDKHAEPINLRAIYEGDVQFVKIEGTDKYIKVGTGRILWDVSQNRGVPYFPLAFEHWYGEPKTSSSN